MGSLSQSNGYKGPALVILDRSRGSTEVARVNPKLIILFIGSILLVNFHVLFILQSCRLADQLKSNEKGSKVRKFFCRFADGLFRTSILALFMISSRTSPRCPAREARCNGVWLLMSHEFASATMS